MGQGDPPRIPYGFRFYVQKVINRNHHLFSYLKAGTERKLPCILSREEVSRILHHVTTHHNYAFFHLVYSCGLRLSEGVNVQISDIDKTRMMIHVHRGKGAKDRYVTLPDETLHVLRKFWVTHRNPTFIFPARGRGKNEASITDQPMPVSTPQGVFRKARYAAGIKKRRVTVHTLRHCYATHLLEAIDAICSCRTRVHGLLYYECEACGEFHTFYRSCGNRHCPACQTHKTR